jgi:hypothetical protein
MIMAVGIIITRYNDVVCGTADTWLYPGGYNDDASTDTWFSAVRICLLFLKWVVFLVSLFKFCTEVIAVLFDFILENMNWEIRCHKGG